MDETSKDGQSRSQKTPEQIRAERIAAVSDPKLRQELDAMVKARDAQLARDEARQKETFNSRVAELRNQKIRSANAPQLTPANMRPSPYLGDTGHARAQNEAKLQVQAQNIEYLKQVAKEHNDRIDNRLDTQRELQQGAEPERGPAVRSRAPNRYAELIAQQNYAERAKQAEANREKQQDHTQQQQRQRGLQR